MDFREIDMTMIPVVGGKKASLGEIYRNLAVAGVKVPDGFATRAEAYWAFLDASCLRPGLASQLERSLNIVGEGIDSISLDPDALWTGIETMLAAEAARP